MLSDDNLTSNTEVTDSESVASATESSTTPAAPPRRRRAASRPAGPPPEVAPPAAPPVSESPREPSTQPEPEAVTTQAPMPAPEAEAPKRPARRRSTRSQAAPEPITSAPAPEPDQSKEDQSEEDRSEEDRSADGQPEAGQPEEAQKPARRTRARRAPREEAPRDEADRDSSSADPASGETSTPTADDVQSRLVEAEAAAGGRPSRRRRVSAEVASPFRSPQENSDDVLQSLAASIAGVPSVSSERRTRRPEPTEGVQDANEELDEGVEPEVDAVSTDEDPTAADATAEDETPGDEGPDADSAEADADDAEDSDDTDDTTDEGGSRRRRRRRGGRRRRRGSEDDTEGADEARDDSGQQAGAAQDEAGPDVQQDDAREGSDDEAVEGDESDGDSGGRRRRRRRRRRGEDTGTAEDDPGEVVVRVREPRRGRGSSAPSDEVTGIEGSTRMEAKRQRRREGRAAGRRRAPILSESEFLARRESVERRMVIRQKEDYTQLAVLEDGILVEHYVDRKASASMIGNVYLGRVQNVLPSMEAAFIDIGRGRNAVLYAGEVDWDAAGATGGQRKVEQALKSGQTVLVQVSKDPVGAKGARLTGHIAIPGRYVVYSPGGHLSGISRKLSDTERHRLKEILGDLIDEKASVIVRTAAEGASEEELVRDVNRLKAQWDVIEKKVKQGSAPQLLYGEPDLTVRIVRDLFTEDFTELLVQGNGGPDDVHDAIQGYVQHVAPHLQARLKRWDSDRGDIFASHKIDEQISKALERKVFLPSGGSLVIDRTEAMTVIDVNTGRFTGAGGNLEATVTSNNLEAAEEVVRQLRLRDIGGIIVVDFIDMVLPNNRDLLIRRLVECLGRDRTRHQVAEVSSLGLVQMTRKKIGTGLAEAFTETCEHCGGRGYHRSEEPVESQTPSDGGDRRSSGGGRDQRPSSRPRRGRRGEGGDDHSAGGGSPSGQGESSSERSDDPAGDREAVSP